MRHLSGIWSVVPRPVHVLTRVKRWTPHSTCTCESLLSRVGAAFVPGIVDDASRLAWRKQDSGTTVVSRPHCSWRAHAS